MQQCEYNNVVHINETNHDYFLLNSKLFNN